MQQPTPENETASIGEMGDRVRDDLDALRDVFRQRSSEMYSNGRRWVGEHPLAAIGAAFGLGYVLAGGLVSKTTWRVARVGARLYLRRFVGELLGRGIAELIGRAAMEEGGEGGERV